eukprot:Colp12_sorted_trinity150504_noHs@20311
MASTRFPGESFQEIFTGLHAAKIGPFDRNLYDSEFPEGLKGGDVVEISGSSSSGKTELLLDAIVPCICPQAWRSYSIGGLDIGVVFVDTEYRFDLLRLTHILELELSERLRGRTVPNFSAEDIQGIRVACGLLYNNSE